MSAITDLVAAMAESTNPSTLRLRRALITAVAANGSCSVKIGGGTTVVANVKVLASCSPVPGLACWVATDGSDMFVIGVLAPLSVANVKVTRATTQAITTGTNTAVIWTAEPADNAGMWTTGANVTVAVPGLYTVSAQVTWPAGTTGTRSARILNGSTPLVGDHRPPVNISQTIALAWTERFAQGAVITTDVMQDTGGTINLTSASLTAIWVGP